MKPSRPLAALALAAAVLVLAPAAAAAQAPRPAAEGPGARFGGVFGPDLGVWDGLGLRLDGELELQRLTPWLVFAGVGSVAFSHLSLAHPDISQRLDLFEVVPAGRFLLSLTRQIGLYGDLGLGLYVVKVYTQGVISGASVENTQVGLAARLGAGVYVWASDVRLCAEVAVHPHTGNYDDTSLTAMVGLMFRLR